MASLGQIVLIAALSFLVLAAQDHGHGGPTAGGGPAIGGAAAAAAAAPPGPEVLLVSQKPPKPWSAVVAEMKRLPIPPSGPSTKWNYEVNHEKPAVSAQSGSGRRRTRAIDGGRRLGRFP